MPGHSPMSMEAAEVDLQEAEPVSELSPLLEGSQATGTSTPPADEVSHSLFKVDLSRALLLITWRPILILIAFSVVGIVVRLATWRLTTTAYFESRGFYGQYGADRWVQSLFPNQTSGFFLDIGAYDGEFMSNTRLLEEHGWRGVCADPFPRNFEGRTCTVVGKPVGPVGGTRERMADCSDGVTGFLHHIRGDDMLSGIRRYTQVFEKQVSKCPERDMYTVGVNDLLTLGNAPRVIDYINLDTEGAELHILQGFPFDRHCVRTWSVEHNCEEPKKTQIQELLQSHGCRVQQVEVDWWAMCPCGDEKPKSQFDLAFHGRDFFLYPPGKRPWSGRVGKCKDPMHTKLSGES